MNIFIPTFCTLFCYFLRINFLQQNCWARIHLCDICYILPKLYFRMLYSFTELLLLFFNIGNKYEGHKNFFKFSKICIQLQLSAISPYPSTPPQPIPPPSHTSTLPCDLSLCPLQQLPYTPLPTIPSPIPSGYCYILLNFNVSGYIWLAFFFCWLCSS